jgi:POT family proton-dependent oligopeptide transporter
MSRITCGFVFASLAMAYTAGMQHMIYTRPPYYDHPTGHGKNDLTAAVVVPSYVLIAISEIFASVTGLEYAFKKAPEKMKSLVMSLFLFTNCIGAILGFALVSVAVDPKLQWMYAGISASMFVCAILFYVCHGKNDATDVAEDNIMRDKKDVSVAGGGEVIEEYEVNGKSAV